MSADPSPHAVVDVTGWRPDGEEQLGTKPKRWLTHPDSHERWLLKYVTFSTPKKGTPYQKGDDWAERIAYCVAQKLGVPAARTELAVEHSEGTPTMGIISKSVLAASGEQGRPTEELVLGNELLAEPVSKGVRHGYTVEAVQRALLEVQPPIGSPPGFGAWDVFVGYLVLDALIGNTDRHEENWAVISGDGERKLAPTFDHASSLGFLLSDEKRQERLDSRDRGFVPEAFADGAKSQFADKPHPIAVARSALKRCTPEVQDHWLTRCADADGLAECVALIPSERISDSARQFAERVLRRNCVRLTDARD